MGLKDNSKKDRGSIIKHVAVTVLLVGMIGLSGCRNKAYVTVYDQNISRTPLPCLRLKVFPPDPTAEQAIGSLYPFARSCPYVLVLSTKAGIHCNSNANVPQKVTSNFPSAYLRLEIRRGMRLLYSYYADLTAAPDAGDIEEAFDRMREDVRLRIP